MRLERVTLIKRIDGLVLFLKVPGPTLAGAMAADSTSHVVSVHRLFLTVVLTYPCRPVTFRMFKRSNLLAGSRRPLRLETLREGAMFSMFNIHRRTVDLLRPLRLGVPQVPDRPPAQVRVDHVRVAGSFHVFVVQFVTVFHVSVLVKSVVAILASVARSVEGRLVSAQIAPHRPSSASFRISLRRVRRTRRSTSKP